MKKKYTWIAVISAILALASAAAAIIIFLQMKKKKAVEAEEVPSDFEDYDIDFLLDTENEEIPDFDPAAGCESPPCRWIRIQIRQAGSL